MESNPLYYHKKKSILIRLLLLLLVVLMLASIFFMYSISGGTIGVMVKKQLFISVASLLLIVVVSQTKPKFIFNYSYHIYFIILITLIITEVLGHKAMGAKRWIDLGIINVQPSEFMKIGIILILSRYFHNCHVNEIKRYRSLVTPVILVALPTVFILKQPNLGTSIIIILTAATTLFLSGVRIRVFFYTAALVIMSLPIVWKFLHTYQKTRILTFLNPENEALGAGYNTIQSIISVGSGGVFGKGFLKGTQNQLKFLPENHTDFIFGAIAEEGGFFFCFTAIIIYSLIIFIIYWISLQCRVQFYRLLTVGFASLFFFHIFINLGMVSGLLPVVGVPLPFLSYGGSNFFTMMLGMGLVLNAYFNKDVTIPSGGIK
jgi:rod shape determining protein RodA